MQLDCELTHDGVRPGRPRSKTISSEQRLASPYSRKICTLSSDSPEVGVVPAFLEICRITVAIGSVPGIMLALSNFTTRSSSEPLSTTMDITAYNAATDLLSAAIPDCEVTRFGCFTTLPVRRSGSSYLCEMAQARLEADWTQNIGLRKAKGETGLENELSGNCVALALPGAVPERLSLITYLAGITTHLDGTFVEVQDVRAA